MAPHSVLTAASDIAVFAERCRREGRFALDFEFLWERTYRPIPCLAQLAVGDDVAIVDPIAGAPLDVVIGLVEDPDVETIMHAPSADLTLMAVNFDARPRNVTDVQLIAGFVGLGAGQSLSTLLDRALGVRLTKVESYSDWSRRPLTAAQLAYAADDVAHLAALRDALGRRVTELGRDDWVAEEHRLRFGPDARFVTDPAEAWRRLKGQGRLTARERAVLVEVAAWREAEARRRDRPPAWILQDRLALDVAKRRPRTREELGRVRGLDERMRDREAASLLDAVRRGLEGPEVPLPPPIRPELAQRLGILGALGQLLVGVRADAARLAAPLLATRDEIEAFVASRLAGEVDGHPLATGWRKELAGDALAALADGRLAIAPTADPPYLAEIERP